MRRFAVSLLVASLIRARAISLQTRPAPTLDITSLGAVGDGESDCTGAFKSALAQVKEAGGGTVVVPAGVFRTGPLSLVSGLTLLLEDGAVIKAIDEFARYPVIDPLPSYGRGREGNAVGRRQAFLSGDSLEMVSIVGKGNATIDGSGLKWWEWRWLPASAPERVSPWDNITAPHMIELRNSMFIELNNLNLRNSPLWHVHFFGCTGATVRNLDIRVTSQNWSPTAKKTFARRRRGCGNQQVDFRPYNTDGIVPDSSEDITIANITYNGGDDVVSLKSGWDCMGEKFGSPTKGVRIRNVTVEFTRGSGVAIGSEMSGGVRDVEVTGLQVRCSDVSSIIVKSAIHRGGYVKDVRVKDFIVGNTSSAFSVIGKVGDWVPVANPDCLDVDGNARKNPPVIEGLSLEGVSQLPGTTVDGYPVQLGQAGLTIKGVLLKDIKLASLQPGLCANAEGTMTRSSFSLLNPNSAPLPDPSKRHNLPDDGRDCAMDPDE